MPTFDPNQRTNFIVFLNTFDICSEENNRGKIKLTKWTIQLAVDGFGGVADDLPLADVHIVNCFEYLSVSRMITSICSSVCCTASLYCASHGT